MIRITPAKAKKMGQEQAIYGLSKEDNPFPADHKYHNVWLDGYRNPDVQTIEKTPTHWNSIDSAAESFFEGEM